MKSIICIIFLFLCGIAWGQDSKKFVINGSIPGIKDGLEVGLYNNNNEKVTDATAITKDGKFVLEGRLDEPVLCFLCIDMTPKVQDIYEKERRGSMLFLDNSVITYSCESVDALPLIYDDASRVKVEGSRTHDLYQTYVKSLAALRGRYDELDQEYLEVYHRPAMDGEFNTRRGLAIVKNMDALMKQMQEVRWQFLRKYENSVVGVEVAMEMLSYAGSSYTKAQIDEVLGAIDASLRQGKAYAGLKEMAENMYPVAKGEKYMDIELTDVDGKTVHLADYVKLGQYTMLEFWASWCGPCRGEIPHLRHVHDLYGDAFNMVSISIDEREKDWKKALKEENMTWSQLNDRKGMKGPVMTKYKVYGVPYSLILDKEGRVVAGGVRGSELDQVLIELLGDKF
jgi:hypothetical protein